MARCFSLVGLRCAGVRHASCSDILDLLFPWLLLKIDHRWVYYRRKEQTKRAQRTCLIRDALLPVGVKRLATRILEPRSSRAV